MGVDLKLLKHEDTQNGQCIEVSDLSQTEWGATTLYVRDDLFAALLNPEFEEANPSFSFFGAAEFTPNQVRILAQLLEKNGETLTAIHTREDFRGYLSRPGVVYDIPAILSREFSNFAEIWPQFLNQFKAVNNQLLSYLLDMASNRKGIYVCGL